MKCSYCNEDAEFRCACEQPLMCLVHLGLHLKNNKNHQYENLDIQLEESRLTRLRSNI